MIAHLAQNRVRRTYRGGTRIDRLTGCAAPQDEGMTRPEDWTASTVSAFNGSFEIAGEGLGRLVDGRLVKDVVGELPILVKLLDADERLVVQAHPTVSFARVRLGSPVGKTECWYFLPGTTADACVYLGFKERVTRVDWERAFDAWNCAPKTDESGNPILASLHRVPVKPGDFVFVAGGLPHAIGAGCFMVELQEPSDLMVVAERFTPSGREIPTRKMDMGLGRTGMFDVYDYTGSSRDDLLARFVRRSQPAMDDGVRAVLGTDLTDKFALWTLYGAAVLEMPRARAVVIVTDGSGLLNGVRVRKGDRLLLWDETRLVSSGSLRAVVCS